MQHYALITGASSGIGREFAYEYAKNGYNVILVARSKDKLEQISLELENKYSVSVMVLACDLTEKEAVTKVQEAVKHRMVSVEVLVNNAGFAETGYFCNLNLEKQNEEIELNVNALTALTYYFLPEMLKRNQGTVINLASSAAFTPFPFATVYAATKAYVLSFTEGLAYEYKNSKVRFIAVCPGATNTNFFDGFNRITNSMREPKDVVRSVFKTMKRANRIVCTDGLLSKLSWMLPKFTTRGITLNVIGHIGQRTWGK